MSVEIKYRGKTVTAEDIDFIKRLIADNPNDSRRPLSVKLCREWNWVQANGAYRDMVCRGLMLLLHRSGHIELPARKLKPNNPFVNRKKPVEIEIDPSAINILPWVRVRHLASHLLGRMVRVLSRDWERVYHHPVFFLETFVDTERFHGTCYKAANWCFLGHTTGRGKNDRTFKQNRSIKAVWGYPLVKDFRERMTADVAA
jgi:hypothetical protein